MPDRWDSLTGTTGAPDVRRDQMTRRNPVKTVALAAAGTAAAAMLAASWAVLPAAAASEDLKSSVASADRYAEEKFVSMMGRNPEAALLAADPAWDGPEWAALQQAQHLDDLDLYGPAIAAMQDQADGMPPGGSTIMRRGMDATAAALTGPYEQGAPLTSESALAVFYEIVGFGKEACASGDVPGYLTGTAGTPPRFAGENSALRAAWPANGPVLVEAAAGSICGG